METGTRMETAGDLGAAMAATNLLDELARVEPGEREPLLRMVPAVRVRPEGASMSEVLDLAARADEIAEALEDLTDEELEQVEWVKGEAEGRMEALGRAVLRRQREAADLAALIAVRKAQVKSLEDRHKTLEATTGRLRRFLVFGLARLGLKNMVFRGFTLARRSSPERLVGPEVEKLAPEQLDYLVNASLAVRVVKVETNKNTIKAALAGPHGEWLRSLGYSTERGPEQCVLAVGTVGEG